MVSLRDRGPVVRAAAAAGFAEKRRVAMKKPYQIEAQRAIKQLDAMAVPEDHSREAEDRVKPGQQR